MAQAELFAVRPKTLALLISALLAGACGGSSSGGSDSGDDEQSDNVAPVLSVSSKQSLFADAAVLQFTASDNSDEAPSIYINGELYQAGSDFHIEEDQSSITVYAEDESGNRSAQFKQTYTIDKSAPQLSFSPSGTQFSSATSVTVSATDDTDPKVALSYSINGSEQLSYQEPILISESMTILFTATDHLGRSSEQEHTYLISPQSDLEAPVLSIQPDGDEFMDEVQLQISAEDNSDPQPKIYINGVLYDSTQAYQVTQHNTQLAIFAEDISGNRSALFERNYTIDKSAPEISVSPENEQLKQPIEVTASVSDDTDDSPQLQLSINGGPLTAYKGSLEIEEESTLRFVATDSFGRKSELVKQYRFSSGPDVTPPVISLSTEQELFKDAAVVQLTVSDDQDSNPAIFVNDQPYSSGSDITISPANPSIFAYAVDASGNRSELDKSFRFDLEPPTLSVSPEGENFSEAVTVSFSAEDDTDPAPALFYAIDDGDFLPYSDPLSISKSQQVQFKAVDLFERESLLSKHYRIIPVVEVNKPVIYQLVVRYFGNTNETNKTDGTIDENGSGKFADINDKALSELRGMGITHIYLTGVIQQSSATDYSQYGQQADDVDILKGLAGSFFAIRDYFDVSPDYALEPENRLDEFSALVERIHNHGMKVMIDFVPNHVSRNYETDIKPELNFGSDDDQTQFFSNQNNFFYYLEDSNPLYLPTASSPTCAVINSNPNLPNCDQGFERETGESGKRVKVTGLDDYTNAPGVNSWYETVKLNYGLNFKDGSGHYQPQPKTWSMMDEVISYWQALGVDGFRTDFSHVVPNEFWHYLIANAKARNEVLFIGEAYASNEHFASMLDAGFDYLYDDPTYDLLKEIFCCGAAANDLDRRMTQESSGNYLPNNLRGRLLRYAENHDEKRIAYSNTVSGNPDDNGFGDAKAGIPVSTVLYTLGSGPVLMLNGQEVGEPAVGHEGFDAANGHTTIFDYWSMPEFRKWVNQHQYDGGQLSSEQRSLRKFYQRLFPLLQREAISSGDFYGLNWANNSRWDYGKNGQDLYSFIRYSDNEKLLVVVNFSRDQSYDTRIMLPQTTLDYVGIAQDPISFSDLLGDAAKQSISAGELTESGLPTTLEPFSAKIFLIE